MAALAHAHLLMTIARMIGNHPNFRIFMMGGFCLAMRTQTGIRAMKPIHSSGVRYRLSVGRGRGRMPGHMSTACWAMAWVAKVRGGQRAKSTRGLRRHFCPQQLRVGQPNIPLKEFVPSHEATGKAPLCPQFLSLSPSPFFFAIFLT